MLGKAKGQILRVAASLEMLFCDTEEPGSTEDDISVQQVETLPTTISSKSLKAAINFIDVCCQHTAYVTGRQTIENEVKKYQQSKCCNQSCTMLVPCPDPIFPWSTH